MEHELCSFELGSSVRLVDCYPNVKRVYHLLNFLEGISAFITTHQLCITPHNLANTYKNGKGRINIEMYIRSFFFILD